ncbi:MFS transporter [Streptomyces sp. NPDC057638]|uniref:MFS transporter n=1 Tax=Streptomyces sp. NPDC057638 TaxID=3346190 RepID=UPI0036B33F6F
MSAGTVPKAGRKEWFGLGILALPTLLVALDVFVLLLALPHLSADLGADSNQQLWIMDIYGFMVAGFLVPMGTLGDRIGRRRLLLTGGTVFAAASLLAAFATSPAMLIAARVLLGVAGAAISPSTLALISQMFQDAKQRAGAIGMWASCFTLGAIIGPMLGGLMLEHFWWGSLFLLGVPVMILLLIAGPKVLPESSSEDAGRIDLPSVALNLGTVLPVIYGIKESARNGFGTLPALAIVTGVALGVAFVHRQRTLKSPLLDVTLFKHGRFSASLLGLLAYSLTGGTVMLLMTQYFQAARQMTPFEAGLGLLPGMAAATVSFMVCPLIARRIRPAYVIGAGITGVTAVLAVFTQIGTASGTGTLIAGFAVFSFCGAPLVALGTHMIVGTVPPQKAGSAGALSQISNEFGAALGVATLGTLGLTVYRNEIDSTVPETIPAAAAEAARDSVSGAAAATESLPPHLADAFMNPVQTAFTSGIHTVTAVSAILITTAGTLFVTRMRHIPPIGKEQTTTPKHTKHTGNTEHTGNTGNTGNTEEKQTLTT